MKKIRVLILNEPENVNGVTWWRMYRPMLWLENMYGESLEIMWNRGQILPIDIERCDLAIAWRPCLLQHVHVLRMLAQKGIPIIADFDDDVINVPTGSRAYDTLGQTVPMVKECIELATQVWVSTNNLVQVYGAAEKTFVIPNAIDLSDIPATPSPLPKNGKAHILWRGDSFQYEDVVAHLPMYKNILLKKSYLFTWYGYMPTMEHPENVVHMRWTNLDTYFRTIKMVNLNYLWKPMRRDIPFNFSKSNIAKLESLVAGGVCLTNFTAADDEQWKYTTEEILKDETTLHGMWEQCRDHVITNYNLESWTHTRMHYISKAVGR